MSDTPTKTTSRRDFLKTSSAAAAGLTLAGGLSFALAPTLPGPM